MQHLDTIKGIRTRKKCIILVLLTLYYCINVLKGSSVFELNYKVDETVLQSRTVIATLFTRVINCAVECMLNSNCISYSVSAEDMTGHAVCKLLADGTDNLQMLPSNKIYDISRVYDWPSGTYGLVNPISGCPENYWLNGSMRHDAEDSYSGPFFKSASMHFYGNIAHNIVWHFCMKTGKAHITYEWPEGEYCLFKYGDCPSGFQSGYIYWDDEDSNNSNNRVGTLPDGARNYTADTVLEFCCREDGSLDIAMLLPTRKPFYLIAKTVSCPLVRGLNVTREYLQWQTEVNNNKNSMAGSHPYNNGDPNSIRLHFCYYY